jgi:hypothetical protein
MQFVDKQATLEFFNPPSPAELETWCRENGFDGVFPTRDIQRDGMPSDHILAAALWYAATNHPDAGNLDICSFAGLVAYLATGWYGGFGTEEYEVERQAENIVIAWAGGVAPSPEGVIGFIPEKLLKQGTPRKFTNEVLRFLDSFYFGDREKAVTELLSRVDKQTAAQIVLGLASTEKQYLNITDMFRAGEVLTSSQVAKEYGITKRNVLLACQEGRLTEKEAVLTPAGWIITRAGAERLWGDRRK